MADQVVLPTIELAPERTPTPGYCWIWPIVRLAYDVAPDNNQRTKNSLMTAALKRVRPAVREWAHEHDLCDGRIIIQQTLRKGQGCRGKILHVSAFEFVAKLLLDLKYSLTFDVGSVTAMRAVAPSVTVPLQSEADISGASESREQGDGAEPVCESQREDAGEDTGASPRARAPGLRTLTIQDVLSHIRRVEGGEFAGYGSIYDVIKLVTGNVNPRDTWASMNSSDGVANYYSDSFHKFRGDGDPTPVAHVDTLIEIVWDCPGTVARTFKRSCAKMIRQAFMGDEALVVDIRANARAMGVGGQRDVTGDVTVSHNNFAKSSTESPVNEIQPSVQQHTQSTPPVKAIAHNGNDTEINPDASPATGQRLVHGVEMIPEAEAVNLPQVSKSFEKRQVFYVLCIGRTMHGERVYMYGWTADIVKRVTVYIRQFVSVDVVYLIRSTRSALEIEEKAHWTLGKYTNHKFELGTLREVFKCSTDTLSMKVRETIEHNADHIDRVWFNGRMHTLPEFRIPESIPDFSKDTAPVVTLEPAQVLLERERTRQLELEAVTKRVEIEAGTKLAEIEANARIELRRMEIEIEIRKLAIEEAKLGVK